MWYACLYVKNLSYHIVKINLMYSFKVNGAYGHCMYSSIKKTRKNNNNPVVDSAFSFHNPSSRKGIYKWWTYAEHVSFLLHISGYTWFIQIIYIMHNILMMNKFVVKQRFIGCISVCLHQEDPISGQVTLFQDKAIHWK